MTLHNTSMRSFVFLGIFLSHFSLFAQSTPVYLKPNNPAATGHFDQKLLKKRLISYDQFEWLWVRTPTGKNGWILKASALLPMDFSRQAVLNKGEGIYPQPRNFKLPQFNLDQSQVVALVERKRDWFKIIYKRDGQNYYGWVRSRYLSPYSKDSGFMFSTHETHLRSKPQMKSSILAKISPGESIIPLNTKESWALVKFQGKKGYIPLQNLKSRIDVAIKVRTPKGYFKPHPSLYKEKVIEIFSNPLWVGTGAFTLDLKKEPSMSSPTVERVNPWASLILQGYSIKKWGKSHISRLGEVWWPESTIESNVEIITQINQKVTKLRSSEVYQIEKSPIVPGLKFASATQGVYRSFDGKNWYPLKGFKSGYPIKVAANGTLFVADKVSFDHGESFQNFVRWDLVFGSMPNKNGISQGPIQILNVEPNLKNHNQVTLSLKVGSNRYLQFYTPDLGKNWRLR